MCSHLQPNLELKEMELLQAPNWGLARSKKAKSVIEDLLKVMLVKAQRQKVLVVLHLRSISMKLEGAVRLFSIAVAARLPDPRMRV